MNFKKEHKFLVCVDSDGCVFDSMDFKHKECFAPAVIKEWNLQHISKYARETWEFINLYSVSRGMNRFPALVRFFELLSEHPEVMKHGFEKPDLTPLNAWIERESILSNPLLKKEIEKTPHPVLINTLEWSRKVNVNTAKMAKNLPPFSFVRESLKKANGLTDVIVVSATPARALQREWAEHDIEKYVKVIAGQEIGSKSACIAMAKKAGYLDENVLMVGDALGDKAAADDNNVCYYPINPGGEEKSWHRFYDEALNRFVAGEYAGVYEEKLFTEFETLLPEMPVWKL
ncbi:MAG: HAD family hydrolase [Firmicutes bacterium]|nr:HAD family hydrolase [Bacillota bacterium]